MSNVTIAWNNLIDAATLATDSEQAELPAANVQQEHLSRAWQTADGVASAYLLADLGASYTCGVLALLGTNLGVNATLRLRGSVSDATATGSLAYDSGTIGAGAAVGYGGCYHVFDDTAARYWRLDLDDPDAADNLSIGRVFLGPKWRPTYNLMYGWSVSNMDESRVVKSYGGQQYADLKPHRRAVEFRLEHLTEAEAFGSAFAMSRARGVTRDVLAIPDSEGSYVPHKSVWGPLSASEPIANHVALTWQQKFRIEERL